MASSFNRIRTQFVRYDTGDLAIAPTGTCTADSFPRADAIVGRSQETFIDNKGRRRSLFGYVFGDEKSVLWDEIRDLQVVQERPGRLLVRFVANPGADKNLIQQTLERRMPMFEHEFEYVSAIERSPSGKRRYFVDRMPTDAKRSTDHPQHSRLPAQPTGRWPGAEVHSKTGHLVWKCCPGMYQDRDCADPVHRVVTRPPMPRR